MLQNVSNQILQSPARLGLPNPNSDVSKFSSQNRQPLQSQNQLPVPPVSPALLPLLPPLPRAQALLLQMAALASKLFEVSPNRAHWISAFRGFLPAFLSSKTQISAGVSSDSSPASASEIIAQFTSLQPQLFEAVAELQEILDLQDAKQKLVPEIRAKDSALLAFANKLKDAENSLDTLLHDYSDYRCRKRAKTMSDGDELPKTTVSTKLKISDILSYAHKISYTTFAPPEFGADQAPLRGALPPAPQEEQMRASQLYNPPKLEGLPDEEAKIVVEPLIEPQMDSNASAFQGRILPNIVVPSGWKPGMPVELPADLPILPPPGWKPGDPVTLPPLDSLPVAVRTSDEQQSRPAAPVPMPVPVPGLRKPPEVIQVRHVKLDIEDDSSDYSDNDGTSDSDD